MKKTKSTAKKKFNSIVVIHNSKLKIEERRTIKGSEQTEKTVNELVEKYGDTEYDIVVTYGGSFDLLGWMQLKHISGNNIN